MGHTEAAELLEETLNEEKAADEKLTAIAESGINQEAASQAHPEDEEEEESKMATVAANGRGKKAAASRSGRR
jgi:hypothetical protein